MEEVTGGLVNCHLPSRLSAGSEGKCKELVNQPLSELTIKEPVFLCHEYYSIILLQQKASAL
jgi:hypothetical protein